jgi:hypothetical protein
VLLGFFALEPEEFPPQPLPLANTRMSTMKPSTGSPPRTWRNSGGIPHRFRQIKCIDLSDLTFAADDQKGFRISCPWISRALQRSQCGLWILSSEDKEAS